MLTLFDFPNPNNTSEQRTVTNVPAAAAVFPEQRVRARSRRRLWRRGCEGTEATRRSIEAYRLLFARRADDAGDAKPAWHF